MRLEQLCLLLDAGDLQSCAILPLLLNAAADPCGSVHMKRLNRASVTLCLKDINGVEQVRTFNSLDAAFSAAKEIGFIAARVHA